MDAVPSTTRSIGPPLDVSDHTTNQPQGLPQVDAVVGVPVAVGVEPSPAGAPQSCTLHASSEKQSLSHGQAHKLIAMLSIRAPDVPDDEQSARAPLDLVCCIDVSGSMRSENKMVLMKQTLDLLITRSGLKDSDRLSLVTFDRNVQVKLGLTSMGVDGRQLASGIVKQLMPGSTTNLSGGTLKAIDVLAQETGVCEGRSRSVLLFTDGLPTEGVTDTPTLVRAVKGALDASAAASRHINLFSFGFGSDHNEDCLRSLATSSGPGGLYYYVRTAEDIPSAFADCLGGLVSVVAQNATLVLRGAVDTLGRPRASISRVLGGIYTRNPADGSIEIGDLFANDEKDLLIELELPAVPGPLEAEPTLLASLRAFNIRSATSETVDVVLSIGRPPETPPNQGTNAALELQRIRIDAAEAMENASRLADAGDLAAGRMVLSLTRERVANSMAHASSLGTAIVQEMDELSVQYRSIQQYRSVGSKMSKSAAMSHACQRASHSTPEEAYAGARAKKKAMKMAWTASMASSAMDEDSD